MGERTQHGAATLNSTKFVENIGSRSNHQIEMASDLNGKVVVVTGAGQGEIIKI